MARTLRGWSEPSLRGIIVPFRGRFICRAEAIVTEDVKGRVVGFTGI